MSDTNTQKNESCSQGRNEDNLLSNRMSDREKRLQILKEKFRTMSQKGHVAQYSGRVVNKSNG